MEFKLEALGITENELQDRVVDTMATKLLTRSFLDHDDERNFGETRIGKMLNKVIEDRINQAVSAIADKHVIPNAVQYLENICLQETNKWGEKKGAKLTFIEYLVSRAEAYLTEPVSYDGKTKGQDSYSWRANGTRVEYLINQHLQYSVETAMKTALSEANKSIVEGLESAVKIKLNELAVALKVEVRRK